MRGGVQRLTWNTEAGREHTPPVTWKIESGSLGTDGHNNTGDGSDGVRRWCLKIFGVTVLELS